MSYARIIDNKKYMYVRDEHQYKSKSLNDNVYFTLRDIFFNGDEFNNIIKANDFNGKLTNNIRFEERDENFSYTNCLQDKNYVNKLCNWLEPFTLNNFDFVKVEESEQINLNKYLLFSEWVGQFENLKRLLREHYNQLL